MTTAMTTWSWADDKIFEGALVKFPDGTANRWEMIAATLAGKTAKDVMVHYDVLMYDVNQIEAGLIEFPSYPKLTDEAGPSSGIQPPPPPPPAAAASKGSKSKSKRKKGKPWTREEHMLFLEGLKIYGKSDWRSISRHLVPSRKPSQVASHAQKYFNRLNSDPRFRKRSSIHDITYEENTSILSSIHDMENSSIEENTSVDEYAAGYYDNNSSSPSVGVSNDTNSSSENFDMSTDAASVGVDENAVAVDHYANYSNANAAAMSFYANNDSLSVGVINDATGVSEAFYMSNDAAGVGVNHPYANNDATGVGVDFHMNFHDTTSVGVNSYMSNDAAGVGVNPYVNNDAATGVCVDFHMNFHDTTSVGVNSYMNINDTSSVGGDFHMEELWGFLENVELDCQSLPESSNAMNTNPTSVSVPADVNPNADDDDDAIVKMLEWPSDPCMESVFSV